MMKKRTEEKDEERRKDEKNRRRLEGRKNRKKEGKEGKKEVGVVNIKQTMSTMLQWWSLESTSYQSLFDEQTEENGVSNFPQTLEDVGLELSVFNDVLELMMEELQDTWNDKNLSSHTHTHCVQSTLIPGQRSTWCRFFSFTLKRSHNKTMVLVTWPIPKNNSTSEHDARDIPDLDMRRWKTLPAFSTSISAPTQTKTESHAGLDCDTEWDTTCLYDPPPSSPNKDLTWGAVLMTRQTTDLRHDFNQCLHVLEDRSL